MVLRTVVSALHFFSLLQSEVVWLCKQNRALMQGEQQTLPLLCTGVVWMIWNWDYPKLL